MPRRPEIVAEARRWLDTPFVHQARVLGVGVDCAGVVFGVAWALGVSEFDYRAYHPRPQTDTMTALLDEHLVRISLSEAREGDVVRFNIGRRPQHLGILTAPDAVLHAYQHVGKCVEHRLDDTWRRRIVSVYQYPGVTD